MLIDKEISQISGQPPVLSPNREPEDDEMESFLVSEHGLTPPNLSEIMQPSQNSSNHSSSRQLKKRKAKDEEGSKEEELMNIERVTSTSCLDLSIQQMMHSDQQDNDFKILHEKSFKSLAT